MANQLYTKLLRRFGTLPTGREKRQYMQTQQVELSSQVNNLFEEKLAPDTQKSIIVVGAGFAGLSAAYYLAKQGHKVSVMEASNRIGGRVLSDRGNFAKGQIIEFGAELIGSNHPQWIGLAKEFGLSFDVVTGEDMFEGAGLTEPLIINGKPVSEDEAHSLFLNMKPVLDALTIKSKPIIWDSPWNSPNAAELDNQSLYAWFIKQISGMPIPVEDKNLLISALVADFENNNVVACDKQSLLAVLAQIKAGGEDLYWSMTEVFRCSGGNDLLATRLCEDKRFELLLNNPVEEIDMQDANMVIVRTKTAVHQADYVVLATPPTVWGKIKMDRTIFNLAGQQGPAVKFMSAVTSRFWIKNGVAPSGLCGGLGMSWEASDNQAELGDKRFGLSCFAGGSFADNILKKGQDEREKYYSDELEKIFKGYIAARQNKHFQSWPAVEWIMTGYSFPALNEVVNKIKPLNEPYKRMYFAGEHTCAGFWGYMEGALRSGMLAAERIQKAIAESE